MLYTTTTKGILKNYLIISLLNRLRNGQCSSFRVWKTCLKNVHFTTWFRLFSQTSNFDRFQFLSQFYCERAIVPLKKALNKVYWKSFLKMKAWEVHTNFIKSTAFLFGNYSTLITLFILKLNISSKKMNLVDNVHSENNLRQS